MPQLPFWQIKNLHEMNQTEWELLCDGCGKCCLHKLIDVDDATETVHYTDVSCRMLNPQTAQCRDYANRHHWVPDCVVITPDNVLELTYLPLSCAYRRLAEGRELPRWHPLYHDGSRAPLEAAGMSAAQRVDSEDEVSEDYELRIVTWLLHDCD